MRYHFFIAAILFIIGSFNWNSQVNNQIRLLGQLGDMTQRLLISEGLSVHTDGLTTVIGYAATQQVSRALSLRANYLSQESATARLNIENHATTRTAEGTPYRRHLVNYDESGRMLGIQCSQEDFNWVYIPSHPDSVKEGPKAGYVAKPNINLSREYAHLETIRQEMEIVQSLLHKLDPDLVIPTQPHFSPARTYESPAPAEPTKARGNGGGMIIEDFKPMVLRQPFTSLDCLQQNSSVSCGQTSVAAVVNWMTNSNLTDLDIDQRYGFHLLKALNSECKNAGVYWTDIGNIGPSTWPLVEDTLTRRGHPVLVGMNGPGFSPNGQGKIILLISTEGSQVTYADPQTGSLKTATKQTLFNAPSHPDGNFIFLPSQTSISPEGPNTVAPEQGKHVFPKLSPSTFEGFKKFESTGL